MEAALNRPRMHWHYDGVEDIVTLAVVLLFGLAMNHPFQQGNKRTAYEAALIFLEDNGYVLTAPDDIALAHAITRVIDHVDAPMDFERLIRPFVVPVAEG